MTTQTILRFIFLICCVCCFLYCTCFAQFRDLISLRILNFGALVGVSLAARYLSCIWEVSSLNPSWLRFYQSCVSAVYHKLQ
jgi:hypothetical protein